MCQDKMAPLKERRSMTRRWRGPLNALVSPLLERRDVLGDGVRDAIDTLETRRRWDQDRYRRNQHESDSESDSDSDSDEEEESRNQNGGDRNRNKNSSGGRGVQIIEGGGYNRGGFTGNYGESPPQLDYPPPAYPTATPLTTIRNRPPQSTSTITLSTTTATPSPPPPIVIIESSTVTSMVSRMSSVELVGRKHINWSQTTTTTTAPLLITPTPLPPQISSQPRKGVDPPPFTSPLGALESSPSPTGTAASATATNSDDDRDARHRKDRAKDDGELDETAEHLLIAAGAIGAFILFCFISWIVYRTVKKSRYDRDYDGNGLLDKILGQRRRRDSRWDNRSVYTTKDMGPPPGYGSEKGGRNSMENVGFYAQDKIYQPGPGGGLVRSNTIKSQRSLIQAATLAPGSVVLIPAEQYMAMSQNQSSAESEGSMTMRSMLDPYYTSNRAELPTGLAPPPAKSYNASQRELYRASQASSISSGFGDGDIIITPDDTLPKPQPAAAPLRQSNNFVGRFSWMSRRGGERETVYTATSEDRPARYRSVTSWVNQQAGRLKRADERKPSDGGLPPVPTTGAQTS